MGKLKETPPTDAQRIEMFMVLGRDYLNFVDNLGLFTSRTVGKQFSPDEEIALMVRTMLERKFITQNEGVHLPEVFDAFERAVSHSNETFTAALSEARSEYNRVYNGTATGRRFNVNGRDLEPRHIWKNLAYGRLLHADYSKFREFRGQLAYPVLAARLDDSTAIRVTIVRTMKMIAEAQESGALRV